MAAIWSRISNTLAMVLAYPIVMLYVYVCNDGGSSYVREADRKARQYEKAVKAAMVERRKCEPRNVNTSQPEISTQASSQTLPTPSRYFSSRTSAGSSMAPQAIGESKLLDLPYELRQQILKEVLGSSTLHIIQHPHRLGHTRCTSAIHSSGRSHNNIVCSRICFHPNKAIQTYRYGEFIDHESSSEDSLSLLLVNRQLYHEASMVLYETNTFDFNHVQSLLFFARSIRPARLATIRSINVTWSGVLPFLENDPGKAPDDVETWVEAWKIISQTLTGLRSLCVRMSIYDDEREKVRSGPFLKYARRRWTADGVQFEKLLEGCKEGIRGLREFSLGVELPPKEEVVWDVGELEKKIRSMVCGNSSGVDQMQINNVVYAAKKEVRLCPEIC
jgi:hypothetical protein